MDVRDRDFEVLSLQGQIDRQSQHSRSFSLPARSYSWERLPSDSAKHAAGCLMSISSRWRDHNLFAVHAQDVP